MKFNKLLIWEKSDKNWEFLIPCYLLLKSYFKGQIGRSCFRVHSPTHGNNLLPSIKKGARELVIIIGKKGKRRKYSDDQKSTLIASPGRYLLMKIRGNLIIGNKPKEVNKKNNKSVPKYYSSVQSIISGKNYSKNWKCPPFSSVFCPFLPFYMA